MSRTEEIFQIWFSRGRCRHLKCCTWKTQTKCAQIESCCIKCSEWALNVLTAVLFRVEIVVVEREVCFLKALGGGHVAHARVVVTRVLGIVARHTSVVVTLPLVRQRVWAAQTRAIRMTNQDLAPTQVVVVATPEGRRMQTLKSIKTKNYKKCFTYSIETCTDRFMITEFTKKITSSIFNNERAHIATIKF